MDCIAARYILRFTFCEKVAGPRGKGAAAAHPDGAANRSGACLAGAFLAPGLLAAAAYFGADLLPLGTGTAGGHVGGDHLVHQRFVVLAAESLVGQFHFAGRARILAAELSWLTSYPIWTRPCRLRPSRPRGPCSAPSACDAPARRPSGRDARRPATAFRARHRTADQQQVARHVDFDDAQIFDGAILHAHVTGHALALEHAARRLALTDGTRARGATPSCRGSSCRRRSCDASWCPRNPCRPWCR